MSRLKSLVTLTKESSNLLTEVADNILNLLPGDWGKTIKRIVLVMALVISLPIIFFMLIITCKCFKFMIWCYKPVISAVSIGVRSLWSAVLSGISSSRNLTLRIPFRRMRESSRSETSVVRYRPEPIESATAALRPPRRPSRSSKARTKLQ